ncbi:oxidoreductase [Consotaella salsifontis]|uniref:NADH-quinone oxidoreductase subunit B family protein n=1 Tax=Consotaella salsifontis TaxID=1365950 RepID=UPI00315AB072
MAVHKFASCDGCQLTLLDCEDQLLDVVGEIEIAYFLEATRQEIRGPYDVSLVEGSITTAHDIERVRRVRAQSKMLIAIGSCATAGGVQALRNTADIDALARAVYPNPEYFQTLTTSTAIQDHVKVDFELRGCPISREQLIEVVSAYLTRRKPNIPNYSQCMECKQAGTVCVMVAHGTPCLGPVTQAGCGNVCPSCERGCYGCFGPKEKANAKSLARWFEGSLGLSGRQTHDLYRTFNAGAPAFCEVGLAAIGEKTDETVAEVTR